MTISVAVIEPVGGHGGMNFYDFSLCRSIVKAGGRAALYTCDKTVVDGTEGFPITLCYRGIYGPSRAWLRGLRFVAGSLIGLSLARISGARIAHFHFFHVGPLELFNVLLARLLRLRTVITAHDVEAFAEGLSRPRLVDWVYQRASRIIAHSHIAKRELVERLGIADQKIDVILHGNYVGKVRQSVTPEMAREHFQIHKDKRVILFFGQIKDVKGLEVLLNGFALARETDKSLHLLIGGRVWKTDFSKYADIVARLELGPFCTLHIRYIPDDEVPYYYRCADLVVLPYLKIYQSGVVLEAMSYGCPVLVSDIPGMLEAVEDESTGFVFKSRDAVSLAHRIAEIFSKPGHSLDIAQAGLRMVSVRNDWSRLGEETLACYLRTFETVAGITADKHMREPVN